MKVVKKRSVYMPTLNSYFVSDYPDEFALKVKALRSGSLGGDKYISSTREWELTEETWQFVKSGFPHDFIDKSVPKPVPLVFAIGKDNPNGLYEYQDRAAAELRKRTECLLFFDTGTGKTRTALLALSALSDALGAVIVVGQANLSKQWLSQVQEHFPVFASRFMLLNNGSSIPKRIEQVNNAPQGTIFVVNIESMRNSKFVVALNNRKLSVCVLDECQCIIGKASYQTQGLHALNTDFRWALSATPIRNNPLEWHSLLAWLRVIRLDGSITRFKQYYAYETRNRFGGIVYETYRNQDDLEDLKNFVSIRVLKDGLGLPPRTDTDVWVSLNAECKSILRDIHAEARKDWVKATFTIANKDFEATNTADLLYLERLVAAVAPEKVDFVLAHAQKPLVVVSMLKAPLEYLHTLMPQDSVLYHGDISEKARQQGLEEFISGKKCVLLMVQKCGGVGLNLTNAHTMIFLDAPYNEADFNQCADRLHRIGQENPVTIYKIKARGTVDEYSWEHLAEKQGWLDRYYKINYSMED